MERLVYDQAQVDMVLLLVVLMEREWKTVRVKGHGELDFFSFMRKKRYGGPAFP